MLAVIAGVIFIIMAAIAHFDRSVSTPDLFVGLFIGLVLVCGHLAFRVWAPDGRRW